MIRIWTIPMTPIACGEIATEEVATPKVKKSVTDALQGHTKNARRVSDGTDNSICHMWNTDRYDSDV